MPEAAEATGAAHENHRLVMHNSNDLVSRRLSLHT
jgi:hypothetical protein